MSEYMRRAPGSYGSRKGKRWSKEWATDEGRAAPSDTAAGAFGAVSPLSVAAVRRAIEAQVCPWCGEGPFKVMALHTNIAHGVDRHELRRMADLRSSEPLCSPDTSERARRNLTGREDWEDMRQKGTAASMEVGALASAVEASVRRGAQAKAAAAFAQRTREANEAKYQIMVERFNAGVKLQEIATELGFNVATVRKNLNRLGHDVAGRVRVERIRRLTDPDVRAKARAALGVAQEVATDGIVGRYRELGGDWSAMCALADERGVSRRSMAAMLRLRGEVVPDGRANTEKRGRASGRVYATKPKVQCSGDECERDAVARGLCRMHYQRLRALGE